MPSLKYIIHSRVNNWYRYARLNFSLGQYFIPLRVGTTFRVRVFLGSYSSNIVFASGEYDLSFIKNLWKILVSFISVGGEFWYLRSPLSSLPPFLRCLAKKKLDFTMMYD